MQVMSEWQSKCVGPRVGLTCDYWCQTPRIQPQRRLQWNNIIMRLNVTKRREKSVSEDLTCELYCKQASSGSTAQLFSYSGLPYEKKPVLVWWKWWKIKAMLAGKNRLHIIYQLDQSSAAKKTVFTNIRRTVETILRKIQYAWLTAKADEIQKYDDTQDSMMPWRKAVYELQSSSTSPLLNADGTTLIAAKTAILNRLADHISAVLNIP